MVSYKISKKIFLSFLMSLFCSCFVLYCQSDSIQEPNKIHTIVIDPGHGGKDPGAVGKKSKEKDIVLDLALRTGKYIEQTFPDVKVIYTRTTDVFVELDKRAEIANKNHADLFISIHINANDNSSVYGTETYALGLHKSEENLEVAKLENKVILMEEDYTTKYQGFDPNSAESYMIFSFMTNFHLKQSLGFAGHIQGQFSDRAHRKNRGVKQAGFIVLWQTSMPSVLVEAGFISNKDEERFLMSEEGKDYMSSAIFRAFREYKTQIESNSVSLLQQPENLSEAKTEIKNDNNSEIEKTKSGPYYKVQVFSSKNKVGDVRSIIGDYAMVQEFKAGDYYKYAVGEFYIYDNAKNFLNEVRIKHPDAFIIAVQNNSIISVSEAKVKLEQKTN